MENILTCHLCKKPIKDNRYYTCENCNMNFHHKCVYKEKKLFIGKPGLRKCKYCNNYMLDQHDIEGFYKNLRAEEEKKAERMKKEKERQRELEKERALFEEARGKLEKKAEDYEINEDYSEALRVYKSLAKNANKLEEHELVTVYEEKINKLNKLERGRRLTLDRKTDRKKIGGLLTTIKRKVQKSIKSGAEAILELENYKDTWTLIHGKIPVLEDDYKFFQQIDESLNQHPNFLHFQIKQYLEELDYIIEDDIKPLPTEIKMSNDEFLILNFSGYLSALIECKKEKINGYTKVYLKEEGVCFVDKQYGHPYFNGNIRLIFAGTVKNMDDSELEVDLNKLKTKIINFLNTELPFKS
ncbi:MAG: hypothetical protein ACTSO9_21785 [Candidatus Helarchaeota archaeon]